MSAGSVLNISAYRFVPLPDAPELAPRLRTWAEALQLKGTVLLAEEGLNCFLAGSAEGVREWLRRLREDERFAGFEAKESWSETQPFGRLKVKIKREIIRMDWPLLGRSRAPAVDNNAAADCRTCSFDPPAGHAVGKTDRCLVANLEPIEAQLGLFRGVAGVHA